MMDYPSITGTKFLSYKIESASTYDSIPPILTSPALPTRGSKYIFSFLLSVIHTIPPNLLRIVISWHRRFSPLGWTIYVLDTVPNSPLNVSRYIDTASQSVVPVAFAQATLDGPYAAQHTS